MARQGGFRGLLGIQAFRPEFSDAVNNPKARTVARRHDFECRFYIGPKITQVTADNLVTGRGFDATVETELAADLSVTATTMTVVSTANFSTGALIIEEGDNSATTEFIKYTSMDETHFYGLQRIQAPTVTEDYRGPHVTGARVVEFVEVTDLIPDMTVTWNDRSGIATWKVSLGGTRYNSAYLDNDNMFLCEMRQTPASYVFGEWTQWHIWFVGYLKDCKIDDSGKQEKRWKGTVEPLSQYLNVNYTEPRHYGRVDLAEEKTVTASTELQDPFAEADTGEYDGYPTLVGGNAVDGDLSTLWISENVPSPSATAFNESAFSINEVFLRPRTGEPADLQWFEIARYFTGAGSGSLKHFTISNRHTLWDTRVYPQDDGTEVRMTYPKENFLNLKGGGLLMDSSGSFIVLCKNKRHFLEKYPDSSDVAVFDWRKSAEFDEVGEFILDEENDFLLLMSGGNTYSIVWWSAGTDPSWVLVNPLPTFTDSPELAGTPKCGWKGPMISTHLADLPRGYSFRREPTNNNPAPTVTEGELAHWETSESYPTPGNHITGLPEWIMIDLGELGILLDEELSASEATEIVLDRDPLGLVESDPSFELVGIHCAHVQINDEVIRYYERDWDNKKLLTLSRAQFGTSAAVHPVGSVVAQFEDNVALTCHAIQEMSWYRQWVGDSNDNPIVPFHFDIFVSTATAPNNPGQGTDSAARIAAWEDWEEPARRGGWLAYWDWLHTATFSGGSAWGTGAYESHRRARWVLMMIKDMTDGGRAKLNEFHVYAATGRKTVGGEEQVFDDIKTGTIMRDLLDAGGFSPGEITSQDGSGIQDLQTSRASYLSIIQDVCRRTGCCVLFGLDQTVEHKYHPLYPLAGIGPAEITWDRDTARSVSLKRPFAHSVSQVTVRAKDEQTDEWFEASYPPYELELGDKIDVDDVLLGGPVEAKSFAEAHFYQKNGPMTISVIPVGPAEWCKPYDRCLVTWDMDEENTYLQGRNFIVVGVSHKISLGDGSPGSKEWNSAIQLQELIW
jgi:hypothetical protein